MAERREVQLSRWRERDRARVARSADKRQAVLQQRREQLVSEATEREAHLQQMSLSQQCRLASETAAEREALSQQMSLSQQHTCMLASKTAEEREACLQQMSFSQQCRLASQSAEEREAKQDSENAFPLVMQSESTCPQRTWCAGPVCSIYIVCVTGLLQLAYVLCMCTVPVLCLCMVYFWCRSVA